MRAPLFAGLALIAAAASCGSSETATTSTSGTTTSSGGNAASSSSSTSGTGGAPAWCDAIPGSGGSSVGMGFTAAWAAGFGADDTQHGVGLSQVIPDEGGGSLVFGAYYQTLDLGPGLTLSAPDFDGYWARVSAAGEILSLSSWPWGTTRADGTGAFWVLTGNTDGTSTLARRDGAGNPLWTFPPLPYGVVSFAAAGDSAVVSDPFLGGPFDYGSGTLPLGAGAGMDVAVLKIGPQGTVTWARTLAPAIWSSPPAVDHWIKPYDFTGGPGGGATALLQVYEQGGHSSMALVQLDASGAVTWTRTVPGPTSGNAHPVLAVDAAGNTLISLRLDEGKADLGCGDIQGFGLALSMVAADGTPRWTRFYPGDVTLAASFDGAGNILLAGEYSDPIDLGGGMLPTPADGTARMVMLKLSADGAYLGSKTFGDGTDNPFAKTITAAAMPDGHLLLAGSTRGSLDLGLASGPLPDQMASSLFVTLLAP